MPARWLVKFASGMVSEADQIVITPMMTISRAGMSWER